MKRIIITAALMLLAVNIYAFLPSAGYGFYHLLGSPDLLADGGAVAGDSSDSSGSGSIGVNPALTAGEERFSADLGFTGLVGGNNDGSGFGAAFQGGVVYPTRYGVVSGSLQGVFSNSDSLDFGNAVTLRAAFSKETLHDLMVGADVSFTAGSGFAAFMDVGVLYKAGKLSWLPFVSDVRLAGAVTGLGLPYTYVSRSSVEGLFLGTSPAGNILLKAGFSGTFLKTDSVAAGLSMDVSVPVIFNDFSFSAGLNLNIKNMVNVSSSWNFNLKDTAAGRASLLPSVSVSVKIPLHAASDSYMSEKGWERSEMNASASVRGLTGNVTAVSAGMTVKKGVPDTEAPVITLFNGTGECPAFMSPNNDGKKDALVIPLSITDDRNVAEWCFVVEDEAGKKVRTIENKNMRLLPYTMSLFWDALVLGAQSVDVPAEMMWNGIMDSGETAPDGIYSYYVTAADEKGNRAESEHYSIVLDNTPPSIELIEPAEADKVFGAGAKKTVTIRQSGSVEKLWTAAVYNSNGTAVRTWIWENEAPDDVVWDGRNNLGLPLASGVYSYEISCVDEAGNGTGKVLVSNLVYDAAPRSVNLTIGESPFSPNGDGFRDTLRITPVMIDSTGLVSWSLTVENKAGETVWSRTGGTEPADAFEYDGRSDYGEVMPDGTYKFRYSAEFSNGQTTFINRNFAIKNTAAGVSVIRNNPVFSPDGDGVLDSVEITQSVDRQENLLWTGVIINSDGEVVREYSWEGFPPKSVVWDGTASDGSITDGSYRYRLTSEDSAGNRASALTEPFELDTGTTDILLSVNIRDFSPNGDGVKDEVVLIPQVKTTSSISSYSLVILDADGVEARTFSDRTGLPERLVWNGISDKGILCSDGEYHAVLTAETRNGHTITVESPVFSMDKVYPELEIEIPYALFSPDGDGRRDELPVNVKKASVEELWIGEIKDEAGNIVRTSSWAGVPESFIWDGTDDNGNVVPDGEYTLSCRTEDAAGNRCRLELPGITVDASQVKVFLLKEENAVSPDGDGNLDFQTFRVTLSPVQGIEDWNFYVKDEAGETVMEWSTADSVSVPAEIRWNGAWSDGYVREGYYYGEMDVSWEKGNTASEKTGLFRVVLTPPKLSVRTAPKEFTPDNDGYNDDLYILLGASGDIPFSSWSFTIYAPDSDEAFWSTSGETAVTERMIWDGRNGSGEYLTEAGTWSFVFTVTDELYLSSSVRGYFTVGELNTIPE